MSIADLLIGGITGLIQKIVVPALPTNLPFLPIEDLSAILNSDLKSDLIYAFSGVGQMMPIGLILIFLIVIIFAEISLAVFKLGVFIINLVRGSGA